MLRATNLRPQGLKPLNFRDFFGTAEAVPSREPPVSWLLGKLEVNPA
jgi:hypothetical protein